MKSLVMLWRFRRQKSCHLLVILWIFTFLHKVQGVPIESIFKKARCYANCLTQNLAANHTERNCEKSNCQECLVPCETPFSDEETCKQICNNASSCLKSCAFLAQVQNFSSILAGDGSLPPTPGIPTVTGRNFTSISLKWDPVQNTSGAVVYLIEITITGEQTGIYPKYLSEVFFSPQATVKFEHPCAYTAQKPSPLQYTDIFFRFKIAALTETSSVSYGPQTSQITLIKPDPVKNVSLDSIGYDSASPGDKIKLTVSWIPPRDQRDLISHYGALFYADSSCQYNFLPSTADSNGAESTLSMHIYHKSLKCIHTLEIYSIVGCSVSYPTVFNYTYPGCGNITNFPAHECYKFDPPYAPIKDRMVSNVTLEGNMTAQQDYRFTAVVTWNPPVYPYKTPFMYLVKWFIEDSLQQAEVADFRLSAVNRHRITNLLPETPYKLQIRPMFPDGRPLADWSSVILTTPGCLNITDFPVSECYESHPPYSPLEDRMVSNVTLVGPMTTQQDYRFTATVTWNPPVYPYIRPSTYFLKWSKEKSFKQSRSAVVNRETITNLLPGTSYKVQIRPVFPGGKAFANWTTVFLTTPGVDRNQVKVRHLTSGQFSPSAVDGSFSVKISWVEPSFNYSTLVSYKIDYLTQSNNDTAVELPPSPTNFVISGILHGERVDYWVMPRYKHYEWIIGIAVPGNATAPGKDADKEPLDDPPSAVELTALVAGILSAVPIVISVGVSLWCYRERKRQGKAGRASSKDALMIDHWEVDGDLVTLEEELGEGAFGKVYKGVLKELTTPSRKMFMMPRINPIRKKKIKQTGGFTVAVKMLHDMADSEQRKEFLVEIQLMKNIGSHKNIVNMLGCCTVQEPMFLLVEYVPYGDLLHYLRKRRGKVTQNDEIYVNRESRKADNENIQIVSFNAQSSETVEETDTNNKGMSTEKDEREEILTPGDLMAFAWQISQGMEYLARKGFVHRDLAARNVLVGEHKIAKVADFGLTRNVYEEKVYHAKRNRKLPLKWMSIEAIFDQTFTTQSDVWAFGVLLWELVTLGGTPYPTINNRELLRLLKGGYRMEKPDICNDEMFSMMTDCWMEKSEERPSFTQIRERLEQMLQKDNPYLDFSVLDESSDYYRVPSFDSLNGESVDHDLFDKESAELLTNENGGNSLGEGKTSENSYKNETTPLSNPTPDIDPVDVNKVDFKNSTLRKDMKVNIEALEMALYSPGKRGIVL